MRLKYYIIVCLSVDNRKKKIGSILAAKDVPCHLLILKGGSGEVFSVKTVLPQSFRLVTVMERSPK